MYINLYARNLEDITVQEVRRAISCYELLDIGISQDLTEYDLLV